VRGAEACQDVVDELTAVIAIDAAQRQRHRRSRAVQRVGDQSAVAHQQWHALDPAAGDVGQHEGVDETALEPITAVRNQVDLAEARRGIAPVGKRAHRDGLCHARSLGMTSLLAGRLPPRTQQSIHRRRADCEHAQAHRLVQRQVPVSLERGHEHWKQCLQALGANPVGGLPEHANGLAYGIVVDPTANCAGFALRVRFTKQTNRVLAVIAGQRYDFVEHAALIRCRRRSVALPQRRQEFVSCLFAELGHVASVACCPWVAMVVRQQYPSGNVSADATREAKIVDAAQCRDECRLMAASVST
jgi:hypothetical protein